MEQNQENRQQMEELWSESNQPSENQKKKGLFWWEILLFIFGGVAVLSVLVIIFVQIWKIRKESYRILEHPMAVLCVKQVPEEFAEDEVSFLEDTISYSNVETVDYENLHMLIYGCTYTDSPSDWLEEQMTSMHVNDTENASVSRGTYTNNEGREFEYICVSISYDLNGETGTSDFLGFATDLGDGEAVTVTIWNPGGQSYVPEDYFKYLDTKAFKIEPR